MLVPRERKIHRTVSTLIAFGGIFLIALLYYGIKNIDTTKVPSALVGKPAKPFYSAWIQGRELYPQALDGGLQLKDLAGKTVVLNFWASWCQSCQAEAQELEAYWRSVKDHGQVAVIGIAIQDSVEDARAFAQRYGKTYPLALDESGLAAIEYGVSGVPETFILSPEGLIKAKETGPVSIAKLKSLIGLSTQ